MIEELWEIMGVIIVTVVLLALIVLGVLIGYLIISDIVD